MLGNTLAGLNIKRLRLVLILFFITLAVPTAILVNQAYRQLKWEAFHHYRLQAEELVTRIDRRYHELIDAESGRTFTDYSFLNIAGDARSNFLQRSPLAAFPVQSSIPGTIGYFQVDNKGLFTSPLLPSINTTGLSHQQDYGISAAEIINRQKSYNLLYQVLKSNRLVDKAQNKIVKNETDSVIVEEVTISNLSQPLKSQPPENISAGSVIESEKFDLSGEITSQSAFDDLKIQKLNTPSSPQAYSKGLGRVEDLNLKKKYPQKKQKSVEEKSAVASQRQPERQRSALRKEQNILPSPLLSDNLNKNVPSDKDMALDVNIFESEIDAFEFSLLESGHFILYRKVWRGGQRYIQGLLIEQSQYVDGIIRQAFYETTVSNASNLVIAYQGNVLSALNSLASGDVYTSSRSSSGMNELQGTLLLQNRLSTPLDQIELIFSVNNLPAGPGSVVITWLSIILLLILFSGFYILYRLGLKQILLARQQQDFVSAVSHELKTPLTSIRLYSEMLREGWTTEEKRKTYYDYICDESERLTRLINNILQLARMTRNELHIELEAFSMNQLIDTVYSITRSQVEQAGFILNLECRDDLKHKRILVNHDFFIQIIINLVDNAIKFSSNSGKQEIDIYCDSLRDNKIQFSIRDYGPGIKKDQMRKIFKLFYRSENELTRETVGTGIGLSLVKQLVWSMKGEIDVVNQKPGVKFNITFNMV